MAMLSLSSFLLRPKAFKPHRLLLPKPLASASALTPPVPRGDPALPPPGDAPGPGLRARRVPPPRVRLVPRWLLADAAVEADPTSASGSDPVLLLRAPLDDLEALWLGHVWGRRPFQYVVGNEHWRDLVLAVEEGVLIPRPETEAVVDMVKRVEGFAGGWWADLGTGSGAIAVAVARELGPGGRVYATDVSDVAIEVARLNVERTKLK